MTKPILLITPTEHRTDIEFQIKESGIYRKPTGSLYGGLMDKAISVTQRFKVGKEHTVCVPLAHVETICEGLMKMKKEILKQKV